MGIFGAGKGGRTLDLLVGNETLDPRAYFAQLAHSFFLSTNSSTIDQVYLNPSLSRTQEQIKIHWDKCDQIESKTVSQIDSLTARPASWTRKYLNRGTSFVLGFFKLPKRSYGLSIKVPNSFSLISWFRQLESLKKFLKKNYKKLFKKDLIFLTRASPHQ